MLTSDFLSKNVGVKKPSSWKDYLPSDLPDPTKNIVIARLLTDEITCRFCKTTLVSYEWKSLRCTYCQNYMLTGYVQYWQDLVAYRNKNHYVTPDLDPKPTKNIYYWDLYTNGSSIQNVYTLAYIVKEIDND